MNPIIKLEKIDKQFPGVHALDSVDIEFYPGEVHALVGENGAGKSTLIKVILGAHEPTSGKMFYNGNEVHYANPFEASRMGIEGVHQELMLIPWLSVWQNVFMNHEIRKPGSKLFDKKKMQQISKDLLKDFGIDIDINRPVKEYSASIWKMIDIARVINLQPKVIVFDEPTAILTEPEVACLFRKIKELKEKNIAVIYISHRLEEINQITDKISILRDGHHINTVMTKDVTEDEIVKMMVGRDVASFYARKICEKGNEIVKLKNVVLQKGQKVRELTVHQGEIIGLAGLVGSGRTEIAESLLGMNKVLQGDIFFKGQKISPRNPSHMISKGVYLLPENRKYEGLILRFSVATNICLSVFRRWTKFLYNVKKEIADSEKMISTLSIKTPSPKQLVRNLSGGNQQKVVIAKALETESDFFIFDEPTVGVDVGAKEEIHNLMNDFVQDGGGILMISSDLPEIIGMCDRVYVMYEGQIVKEFQRDELTAKNIADYMLGSKRGETV